MTDELSILAQVPDGLGAGLFHWAPDWIPGVPWDPGTGIGSPNVNLTLFTSRARRFPPRIFGNPAGLRTIRAGQSPAWWAGVWWAEVVG